MATQTRSRAGVPAGKGQPPASGSRKKSAAPPSPGFGDRLRGGVSSATSSTGPIGRYRHEIVSAILLLLGLISLWSLVSPGKDGWLVQSWYDMLVALFGKGAFIAPILLFAGGIRAVRDLEGPMFLPRHIVGAVLFTMSICGLLALSAPEVEAAGGYIGSGVTSLYRLLFDDLAIALILLPMGIVSIFLLCGIGPRHFGREVNRLLIPKRQPKPVPPFTAAAAATATQTANSTSSIPKTRRSQPPIEAEMLPSLLDRPVADEEDISEVIGLVEASAPVINIPKAEERVEEVVEVPVQATLSGPVPAGEKLPMPEVARLAYYESVELDTDDLAAKAQRIEETLASFRVDARVREINPGPAVTQYTLEPGSGVKVRRITELQNDLALALAAPTIRIEAPVPGMARVGLEIPNPQVATVGLRETLESSQFHRSKAKLPMPLGRDVNGRYVVGDLTKMPHILIAGATGSGKSVCVNAIISTFLLTRTPDEVRLLMIDPKMVELAGYNGVPHLQCPVITEMDKVVSALRLVVAEMQRRYDLFNKAGVRNLDGYRMKIEDEPGAERIPYLVVILDELADLMLTSPVEVEALIQRLTQMGRASGIHLILATQRPSVDVITGVIKANVPARIAFAVTSLADSRVILDMPGAERLLGRGDMLFLPPDAAKPARIQGAFVEDKDVHYIVNHWHNIAPIPHYPEEWVNLPSSNQASVTGGAWDEEDDPLRERALEIVREQGTASASMLQRRLRIGYNRAARLIEQFEEEGIIGPADGVKGRPVLGGH